MLTPSKMSPPVQETAMAAATNGHSSVFSLPIVEANQTNSLKQAASLPNSSSGLSQLYLRNSDSHFLIPTIVTPSIPTSTSDSFAFPSSRDPTVKIHQAISAPATPTNGGFAHAHPPRRGKGNQNDTSTEGKQSNSKSNSNLAHVPCKFYKAGSCTAGKNCTFSHEKNENYVCKYFLKGNCKFGTKCALNHVAPGERKISNGRNPKNGSSGQRGSISVPEHRSPAMPPQGYGPDQNDFPMSSPGDPFTRISLSPTAEYVNSRKLSQLTASLNGQAFSDDAQDSMMRNFSPTYGDHLTAPIQIHNHRRSMPDIFQDHFGTSPFHHNNHNNNNNNRPIFFQSYGSDSGIISPPSSAHLQSIPEIRDFQNRDGNYEGNGDFDEIQCLPSSLNELFTPIEKERRLSRQEDSRRTLLLPGNDLQNQFSNVDPSHIHQFSNDPSHIHQFAGRSLPHGISVGAASYFNNHSDSQYLSPGYTPINFLGNNMRGLSNSTTNASFTQIANDWNNSPNNNNNGNNHHHQNSYSQQVHQSIPHSATFSNDSRPINIPGPHEAFSMTIDRNSPAPIITGIDYNNHEDDTPFAPFAMDDPNEMSKPSEPPQLSYSAITKTGLKDSGATSGLSIDSRLPEQLCPFGMAGNCRFGDRCYYPHGIQCPSCLKHVLHPTYSPEKHQEHIDECTKRQIKVANGIKPEEIECGICMEKVLSKPDARFGLLDCEHAFCLSCIREWRANNTKAIDSQVIRSCPICRIPCHFITPSTTWITDHEEKKRVIDEYKRKCSNISCHHFNYGNGQCPFGISCFYAHVYRDGTKETANIRKIQNGEEVRTLDKVRLWDFVEVLANKRGAQATAAAGDPEREIIESNHNFVTSDDDGKETSADVTNVNGMTPPRILVNSTMFTPSGTTGDDQKEP